MLEADWQQTGDKITATADNSDIIRVQADPSILFLNLRPTFVQTIAAKQFEI